MSPSTTAFREALKATATGSMTVLLSTVASCGFAVAIETGAHRLQYHLFPHWYDGKVKYAMGLPHLQYQQLDSEVKVQVQAQAEAEEKATSDSIDTTKQTQKTLLEEYVEAFSLEEKKEPMWKEEIILEIDNSQTNFQIYQEKLEEKVQLLQQDRLSKILLTTAMTG